MKTALVLGSTGFIGSHLVARLKREGYWVRGADQKFGENELSPPDSFFKCDLRDPEWARTLVRDRDPFDEVYQLAADMGGAGYVFTGEHDADIMTNSLQINLNLLRALKGSKKPGRIFFSSSACIYPQDLQTETSPIGDYTLREERAYPADPDSNYGWEKLTSERLFHAYSCNYGLDVRVARLHNIYGPLSDWRPPRSKSIAAICAKVAQAKNGKIELWGDGTQVRSYCWIDDCIEGIRRLMTVNMPVYFEVNLGSDRPVTISELAHMIIAGAGLRPLEITWDVRGPIGVAQRNSDNRNLRALIDWVPSYPLEQGLAKTYAWVADRVARSS
jgi:GDP-D-mannose 3', 5'-epimerase